jgi:putative two-component system response regulator
MISQDKLYNAKILIIDDSEISVRLMTEILKKAGFKYMTVTKDPREAKTLYTQIQPDLVILDLNMPHFDGFQVMGQLQEIEKDSYVSVLVLSNEESQELRHKALAAGAKDFLNKPIEHVETLIRIRNLLEVKLLQNEIRFQNKLLEQRVRERTIELYETQLDVIQRLARAIEYRDSETGMHIVRMSHYSESLARRAGLSAKECEMIVTAAPLHDIGKIGIPDRILCKPGKLTPEEWEIMKAHTTIGAELLSGSHSELLMMARKIALTHHEKWNGLGYPNGLKEDQIPFVGRICGICDVYDALISKRPYKKAWSQEETLEEIKRLKGTHFDPFLVDCFFDILPEINHIDQKYHDPHHE